MRFVRADQRPAALLAHIDLACVVGGVDDLLIPALKFGYVFGQEIVVFHRQHRQLDADHMTDLTRPQAPAIDDMLGMHRALVGHDIP